MMKLREVLGLVSGARSAVAVCPASPGERIIRAGASIIVAAFAVSVGDDLWYAVPAGLCAVFLMSSATMGSHRTSNSSINGTEERSTILITADARPTAASEKQ